MEGCSASDCQDSEASRLQRSPAGTSAHQDTMFTIGIVMKLVYKDSSNTLNKVHIDSAYSSTMHPLKPEVALLGLLLSLATFYLFLRWTSIDQLQPSKI